MTSEEAKQLKPGDVVWTYTPHYSVHQITIEAVHWHGSTGAVYIHSANDCAIDIAAFHTRLDALKALKSALQSKLQFVEQSIKEAQAS